MGNTSFILASIGVFLVVILLLVIILLVAKKYLSPSGNVNIVINGDKTINVPQGSSLMTTLNENGIFLPSACGGKESCGQCKVQVLEGGGEILDSEKPYDILWWNNSPFTYETSNANGVPSKQEMAVQNDNR